MNDAIPKQDMAADARVRLTFMRITPDTTETLAGFWPHVRSALPEMIDGFYRDVIAEPALARLVGTQTERLKRAQGTHWERLFSGRFDAGYFDSVRAVGLVHAKIGLEPRWYIGGYNFVLGQLGELVGRVHRFAPKRAQLVMRAVVSAVLLDMDVAISVYQERVIEAADRRSNAVDGLARGFEAKAGELLGSMEAAADEMVASARELSGTAETSTQQAANVAAAVQETSAGVQTVAASAEELSASISEIAARSRSRRRSPRRRSAMRGGPTRPCARWPRARSGSATWWG